MFNTEWDGEQIRMLDAAGHFAISPELNIWARRLLSPSDRANMAGPYYSPGGGYWAGVASRFGYNGGIFRGPRGLGRLRARGSLVRLRHRRRDPVRAGHRLLGRHRLLFDQAMGWGKLQHFVRYQEFSPDTSIDTRQADAGVNYIIDGYNAQLSAVYSRTKVTANPDQSRFVVTLQLQY
jgi:hypothetical protein